MIKTLFFLFLILIFSNSFAQQVLQEVDYLKPGWTGNYKHGIGFSSSFSGNNTFIFDTYKDSEISYTAFLGFAKSAGSASKAITNNGTTIVEVNSGTRSLGTISIAGSYNYKIFRNDWTNIKLGPLFGLNIYLKDKYDVGTKTTTIATGTDAYSGFGTAELSRDIQCFFGPILSTALNLRWLPMITVGIDSGILLYTSSTTKTVQSTNTAGVTSTVTTETDPGLASSTFGNGIFNLFGNFNIRYVW
jgi:hypothetical protein